MRTNCKALSRLSAWMIFLWVCSCLPFSLLAAEESVPAKRESIANWVRIEDNAVIRAPIHTVALFFKDIQKSIRMTPGLKNKIILQQISDTERIDYDHFKLPWPFKDRYLIYLARQEYDSGNEILFTLNSLEDYPYEDTEKIPGQVGASSFLLQSEGPNAANTKITLSMRVDPRGWLPVWLINFHTQNWSKKLFKNLQEDIDRFLAGKSDAPT